MKEGGMERAERRELQLNSRVASSELQPRGHFPVSEANGVHPSLLSFIILQSRKAANETC